jgi:hypothetical protein
MWIADEIIREAMERVNQLVKNSRAFQVRVLRLWLGKMMFVVVMHVL